MTCRTGSAPRGSPHLHFGEIAPWRIAHALERLRSVGTDADIDGYLRQLGWRDFAYHLLHHFPKTPTDNLNPRFDRFLGPRPLQRNCMTGSAATPACRSSMRACASCGTPVTCTTGYG